MAKTNKRSYSKCRRQTRSNCYSIPECSLTKKGKRKSYCRISKNNVIPHYWRVSRKKKN